MPSAKFFTTPFQTTDKTYPVCLASPAWLFISNLFINYGELLITLDA